MTDRAAGRPGDERAGWRLVVQAVPRGPLGLVLLLALAGSLTEGLGVMLLVPLLGLVGAGGSEAAGVLARWPAPARLVHEAGLPLVLVLFVGLLALRAALVQGRTAAEQGLQLTLADTLRRATFRALLGADWLWLSQLRQARVVGTVISAVDRVTLGLQHVQSLFAAMLTLAIMLGAAVLIDPLPAMALGAGGLLVLAIHAALRRQARRDGDRASRAWEDYHGFYLERLANLRLIRSFGAEPRELVRAADVGEALRRVRLSFVRGLGLGSFALQVGAGAVLAATVWLAVTRWGSSALTLLPLVAISARAVPLLTVVQSSLQNLTHDRPALADLGRCHRESARHAEPAAGGAPLPQAWRELRLEGLGLAYPGRAEPALADVTLAIAAGSTVHLAGRSGAGKSSLADLLAGLVSPTSGRVLVDDVGIGPGERRGWRGRVAYVQQEPVLFHATIRDNLLWAAPDAGEAELGQALRDAAAGFVLDLPRGLDTVVGERGASLSGGERQRIVLARGLLRRPELLILDEVTSALDAASEAEVTRAVAGLRGRMTVVIIGHRGALAELAERRVVLDGGRVISDTPETASQFVASGTAGAMKG